MKALFVVACLALSPPARGDATVPSSPRTRPDAKSDSPEYTAEQLYARLTADPSSLRSVNLYRIQFRPGTAELVLPASEPTLREVLRLAERLSFLIIAHTDQRGSESFNQRLSDARARAIADWLFARGAEPKHVIWFGAGERVPLDPGSGPAAWAKNARIVLSTAWP